MASVLPHLELDNETTELQSKYWDCGKSPGLGEGPDPLCPTPQSIVDQSHANLLTIAYTRQIVIEQLKGKTITPMRSGGDFYLQVNETIPGPVWNPMSNTAKKSRLLSWTTKMCAPSFSLPAGSKRIAGSCPGANAGQSIIPDEERERAAKLLLPVLGVDQVDLTQAICQFCYAEGGQYATGSVQFYQILRYAWTRQAIREDKDGNRIDEGEEEKSVFVQVMIRAIESADFKTKGRYKKDGAKKLSPEPPQWGKQHFFRLHDSGDFFALQYLRCWKQIANHFKNITFWAPTRIWTQGERLINEVSKINGSAETSNLVIRPSGFHINMPGPPRENYNWSGWSGATTVYKHGAQAQAIGQAYDWNCKAYEVDKGPNCRDAEGENGEKGCRTCWLHKDARVNYTLHGAESESKDDVYG